MILELIWSKISLYFGASMPWDDGLQMDSLEPLLVAIPMENEKTAGWYYKSVEYSEKILKRDCMKWVMLQLPLMPDRLNR